MWWQHKAFFRREVGWKRKLKFIRNPGSLCQYPTRPILCCKINGKSLLSENLRRSRRLVKENTAICYGKEPNTAALGKSQLQNPAWRPTMLRFFVGVSSTSRKLYNILKQATTVFSHLSRFVTHIILPCSREVKVSSLEWSTCSLAHYRRSPRQSDDNCALRRSVGRDVVRHVQRQPQFALPIKSFITGKLHSVSRHSLKLQDVLCVSSIWNFMPLKFHQIFRHSLNFTNFSASNLH